MHAWLNEHFNPSHLSLCPQQSVAVKMPKEVVQFLLKQSLDVMNNFMSMQDKMLLQISTINSSNEVVLNEPTLEDHIVTET